MLARYYPRRRIDSGTNEKNATDMLDNAKVGLRRVAVEFLEGQKRTRRRTFIRETIIIYLFIGIVYSFSFSTGQRNRTRAWQAKKTTARLLARPALVRPLPRFSSLTIATRNRMYLFRSKESCTCIIVSPFFTQGFLRGRLV